MAGNNSGGPWGGGGDQEDHDGDNRGDNRGAGPNGGNRGGRPPSGQGPQIPDIDDLVRKGQEHLRVLMGGRGGSGGGHGGSGGSGLPSIGRGSFILAAIAVVAVWLFASLYTVKPEQKSVELLFGKFYKIGNPGLNFAPWPFVIKDIVGVTRERSEDIGGGANANSPRGLMLTSDENIVNIDFQVVWNISDPANYLFSLANPKKTVAAVSESVMREIIARTKLAPILNKDRGAISSEVQTLVQKTLNSYDSGINIVRINFERADPPPQVIDAFRQVQAAEQTRDTLKQQADAYANKVIAGGRGQAAQLVLEAQGYSARVVNIAQGEASRFNSIYQEYVKAPKVTRKRIYLDAIENVLAGSNKIIMDGKTAGNGVVPYLPLKGLNVGGAKK